MKLVLVLLIVFSPGSLSLAQAPTLCSNGMCVLPEKNMMDLLSYIKYLERTATGKCI